MPEDYETDPDAGDDANGDAAPSNEAGDGLPGVAVAGYPGLRAGAFGQGDGALGIYGTTDGADGSGDSPGYQTISWRDTDPQAIAYDLQDKQRQLGDAQTMAKVLGWGGAGQTVSAAAAKAAGQLGISGVANSLGALADPYVGVAGLALGGYMGGVEAPRLQNEINALQARQRQPSGGRT